MVKFSECLIERDRESTLLKDRVDVVECISSLLLLTAVSDDVSLPHLTSSFPSGGHLIAFSSSLAQNAGMNIFHVAFYGSV